jgi:PD-(D/E)XK nuclease superfamily
MDIIPSPKKNVIMDATTLSSLMSCGRFFDLRFNNRFIAAKGKSNSLEIGSLIHKVLEVYYKHRINSFPSSTAIGNALIAGQLYVTGCPFCADGKTESPSCGHEPEEYPGMQNTPEQNDRFVIGWRFALQTCEQYFEFYKNDAFIPLSAEEVKRDVLYEDDEIRIMWKAKFDLIIDTNQIGIVSMDHKTFKQRRDKSTLSNQFSGQCLLLKSRNVIVNKIGLQTTLKIDERLTREVVSFSADRLDEWKNQILPYYAYKYIQYAESGYWPPDYTHCDTLFGPCPYKNVCEADRGMREEVLRNEFVIGPVWDPKNKEDE